jgi:hypothetical protein
MSGTIGFSKNLCLHNLKKKPLLITPGVVVLTNYFNVSGFQQTSRVLCTVQLYITDKKTSGTSFGNYTKILVRQLKRLSFWLPLDVQATLNY